MLNHREGNSPAIRTFVARLGFSFSPKKTLEGWYWLKVNTTLFDVHIYCNSHFTVGHVDPRNMSGDEEVLQYIGG
jgi:hypothetical protein